MSELTERISEVERALDAKRIAEDRKSETFWAVLENHSVEVVTGYECPQPGAWWCPSLGFTMAVGFHLFKDKESAKAKARQEIHEKMALLEKQLSRLNEQL